MSTLNINKVKTSKLKKLIQNAKLLVFSLKMNY